ncbi:MAG: hypothetical protein JW726_06595 [Anaerolineales bacterium]|nr:hypothetical protein [Anaerolineales bacterium]
MIIKPLAGSLVTSPIKKDIWLGLFLLSAATLTFEITLTRLFSVAQFYHFAFMIVSIALLGLGASGSALTILPLLQRGSPAVRLAHLSLATGISILLAYLLTNWLPFDSYSIAWDSRQVIILVLHYIALAAPFFFSGMALGLLLTNYPDHAGPTYAINLLGSAMGCIIALVAPAHLGGEGMVTLSSFLAVLAATVSLAHLRPIRYLVSLGVVTLFIINALDLSLRLTGQAGLSALELRLSPYKSLSYALQYPEAQVIYRQWNAFSRVDVVRSGGIHTVPGLSYRYLQPLPLLDGLLVDGDDINPLIQHSVDPSFVPFLSNALAFQLRPQAKTLLLGPRGGLDVLVALSLSKGAITCVEVNPLIIEAAPIYNELRIQIYQESERSYLQRSHEKYDIILLSLTSSFHPVQSGAYTLAEDYRYTVEAFQEMLMHLAPDGILVATRWLQDPPSEDLRLFALAVTALETTGADPRGQIVAYRGYNTITVLIKNAAFSPAELTMVREFAGMRAFDLIYAPDIRAEETNQYNILPESHYYQTYLELLGAVPRQAFFNAYDFDVRPPTDDHPFYGHYFKWAQTPAIWAVIGKAWLPFGGGGYLVILALLLLAILLACSLVLLPVVLWKLHVRKQPGTSSPFLLRNLVYFGLLGFAFLFVEVPLLQRFILYLGNPAYAVTTVLFSLLFFSGWGSRWSERVNLEFSLGALVALILLMPLLLPFLFSWTLGLPLLARLMVTVLVLSPLGFLMGIPFPAGLRLLTSAQAQTAISENEAAPRTDIPWIWAVNGAASVVSPILAALLALTYGFSVVLRVGALCYAVALITVWMFLRSAALRYPAR